MKTRVSPRRKFYHARCRLLWLCEVWFSGITWHSERLKTISIDGRKKAKQSEEKNRVRGRREKKNRDWENRRKERQQQRALGERQKTKRSEKGCKVKKKRLRVREKGRRQAHAPCWPPRVRRLGREEGAPLFTSTIRRIRSTRKTTRGNDTHDQCTRLRGGPVFSTVRSVSMLAFPFSAWTPRQPRQDERKRKEKRRIERVDRTQRTTEARSRASRRSVEQTVLPIGWHCVQRRGARPPSAFIVFPRRASSRLGGARRFSPLSVPRVSAASRAPVPHLYV